MNSQKSPKKSWKICKFWFPVVAYSGIIFWVSSIPKIQAPLTRYDVDKLFHMLEYIPFGLLTARAFFHTKLGKSSGWLIGLSVLLTFLFGLSDEYHQSFVEGRFASIWDALADTIGGLLGAGLFMKWMDKKMIKTG